MYKIMQVKTLVSSVGVGLALVASVVNAALPARLASGEPLPTLAPMLEKVTPAVVNLAT